jgi:hypothetical protein
LAAKLSEHGIEFPAILRRLGPPQLAARPGPGLARSLEADAVLDSVKEPLGRLGCQGSRQNGLACLAANLGMRIHDANHVVSHHIAYVRKALLQTDTILARITCMNDYGPRIYDATITNRDLALIHPFLAALERQLGPDNVLVANAEHACLLMQSGKKTRPHANLVPVHS